MAASWYAVKGPNGDLTWRVESPADAVGATVRYIPDGKGWERVFWPNTGKDFPWTIRGRYEDGKAAAIRTRGEWERATNGHTALLDAKVDYPNQVGEAAVFTRPLAWLASHMMEMRSQGIRVLAEVDDFYLASASQNIFTKKAAQKLKWEDYIDDHARSICVGDGIIFSTEHLRDLYWKALRKMFGKSVLPEMFVCRNYVDRKFMPETLPGPRGNGEKLRIGFMGSDSHYWDVELIYPALKYAYDQGHEIVFVGINPRYSMIKPTAAEERQRQHWWDIEFTHIPWSNHFRGVTLPLDIGFAPLVVTQSSLGKSDIKWMEYALSGAACIAQNCLVFNRTAKHGETVLFAASPAEFGHRLMELIGNSELRRRLVENARQYIAENRMIENNQKEWRDAVYG